MRLHSRANVRKIFLSWQHRSKGRPYLDGLLTREQTQKNSRGREQQGGADMGGGEIQTPVKDGGTVRGRSGEWFSQL